MLVNLIIVAGIAYAVYRLFPEQVFNFAVRMQRRASGLVLKDTMLDDHRVPYLEGGHGEPLLLLHGFGAEKDHWTQVAKFLTPHFRVIAPDLPGFGESSRRPDARYDLDHQLDRIGKFAASVGISKFHLGGNSMGGYVAAMYAARAPEQVSSLWLLAPVGVAGAEESELFRMIRNGDNILLADSEAAAKRLAALLFAKMPFVPEGFNRVWRQRAMRNRTFNAKIFEEMFSQPVTLNERVNGLTTPALIAWGDDDRMLHVSGADALKKLLPNANVRIMPYMGHCPMIERPRDTAVDFLNFHRRAIA